MDQFDWDSGNLGHIAPHGVSPEEAEQVLLNDPCAVSFDTDESGEDRWTYLGETDQARILQVIVTVRGEKIRIVTAFEPIKRLKLFYLASKAEQQ